MRKTKKGGSLFKKIKNTTRKLFKKEKRENHEKRENRENVNIPVGKFMF